MEDTEILYSNSMVKTSADCVFGEDDDCSSADSESVLSIMVSSVPEESRSEEAAMSLDVISKNESNWIAGDDDSLSLEAEQVQDNSCSLLVVSDSSSICTDFLAFDLASDINGDKSSNHVEIIPKSRDLVESDVDDTVTSPVADGSSSSSSVVVVQLPALSATVSRSVFEVDYVPLWGYTSLCGRRPEMEDAFATVPRFLKNPLQMLIGDRVLDGLTKPLRVVW